MPKYRFNDGSLMERCKQLAVEAGEYRKSNPLPSKNEELIAEFNKPLINYEEQKSRVLEPRAGNQTKAYVPTQKNNYMRNKYRG